MVVRVHVDRVVRTRLSARFAADASAVIKIDDAVLAGKQRLDRTYLNARRVGAVIAPHHRKQPPCVWESPLLYVFHPRAVYADRHFVLGLARYRACMAADTLAVVDDEAVVHESVRV
jgi:hypothetical protein